MPIAQLDRLRLPAQAYFVTVTKQCPPLNHDDKQLAPTQSTNVGKPPASGAHPRRTPGLTTWRLTPEAGAPSGHKATGRYGLFVLLTGPPLPWQTVRFAVVWVQRRLYITTRHGHYRRCVTERVRPGRLVAQRQSPEALPAPLSGLTLSTRQTLTGQDLELPPTRQSFRARQATGQPVNANDNPMITKDVHR